MHKFSPSPAEADPGGGADRPGCRVDFCVKRQLAHEQGEWLECPTHAAEVHVSGGPLNCTANPDTAGYTAEPNFVGDKPGIGNPCGKSQQCAQYKRGNADGDQTIAIQHVR